jgi:hypothetical protein
MVLRAAARHNLAPHPRRLGAQAILFRKQLYIDLELDRPCVLLRRHAVADLLGQPHAVSPCDHRNVLRILGTHAEGPRPAPRQGEAAVPHHRLAVPVACGHAAARVASVQGYVEDGGEGRRIVKTLDAGDLHGELGGAGRRRGSTQTATKSKRAPRILWSVSHSWRPSSTCRRRHLSGCRKELEVS